MKKRIPISIYGLLIAFAVLLTVAGCVKPSGSDESSATTDEFTLTGDVT